MCCHQVLCSCEAWWRGVLLHKAFHSCCSGIVLHPWSYRLCVLQDCELVLLAGGEVAAPQSTSLADTAVCFHAVLVFCISLSRGSDER